MHLQNFDFSKNLKIIRRFSLALLLILGFTLRIWNVNWDEGTHQHPDERYWSMVTEDITWPGVGNYFDSSDSSLNPYNHRDTWVYGTLPLFITKAASHYLEKDTPISNTIVDGAGTLGIDLEEQITTRDGDFIKTKAFDSGYRANLIGRLLSAVVDTGTILLVYLLGRELFNRKSGFLSAIFQTFTVLHIQYSHFFGSEPWIAFFATLTVLLSVKLFKHIRLRNHIPKLLNPKLGWLLLSVGLAFGLATASKLSGLAVGIVPLVALTLCLGERIKLEELSRTIKEFAKFLGFAALTLLTAFLVFRVFQPYAFNGLISLDRRFTSDIDYLTSINSGADVPWVLQWVGITPFWYPLKSIFWHGMGPTLAIATVLGLWLTIYEVTKKRKRILLIPLSFLFIMLGLVSQQFNPLIRYLLPVYPVATTFAGYGVYFLWQWGKDQNFLVGKNKVLGRISQTTAVALIAGTLLWGAAFVNGIYNETHPRISASAWINENIDSGSTVTHQIWDDRLPLPIQGESRPTLNYVDLDLFRSDVLDDPTSGKSKLNALINNLEAADYVIESSNRLYSSIPRVPAEYPGTSAYYNALFSGDLGFELVAEFENSPSLFGISLSDADGEETFTVYDHPRVTIWSKTSQWSRSEAFKIINPFRAIHAPNLEPKDAGANALLLRLSETAALENDLTFDDTFAKRSYLGIPSWVWWLLWIQLAAFAVLPWSTLLFRQLADGGYALSKAIGFLSCGLLLWVFVVWDLCKFSQESAIASMLVISGIGLYLWWVHRVRLYELFRKHRYIWLASEVIFLAIFSFLLALRSLNPDLWESYLGGEKPMELGYLTAVGRSPELPPYDPWFAGGAMNYYYFGWFLLAVPMRALKILPEVGFQLGVATFGALVGIIVFSVVYNLVMIKGLARADKGKTRFPAIVAGSLGLFLFLGAGTFDAVRVHFARLKSVNTWTTMDGWPVLGTLVELAGGTWSWISGTPLQRFDWWASSRVNSGNFDITEFPYFTFLFGDLHPHMMGMAVSGLVLSFALAYMLSCREEFSRNKAILAACIGLLIGVVRMTNTWDYPTSLLLMIAVFFFSACISPDKALPRYVENKAALFGIAGLATVISALSSGGSTFTFVLGITGLLGALSVFFSPTLQGRILQFICHFLIAVISHIALIWPYLRDSQNFNVGVHRAKWTSPIDDFLSHWGVFLAITSIFFAVSFIESRRTHRRYNITVHFLPSILRRNIWTKVAFSSVGITFLGLCIWGISTAFALTILGGFCAVMLAEYECRNPNANIGRLFALLMFMFGFAVIGGPEIITVNNDVARMNTVFKFWLQGWLFFAIGSAFAIYHIWTFAKDSQKTTRPEKSTSRVTPQKMCGMLVIATIGISLIYPLFATKPRISTRFSSQYQGLNGIAYLDYQPSITRHDDDLFLEVHLGEDLPLIHWLRSNVSGSPTIVEWSGESYDWNSRIAVHTGLPTVLGWSSHQYQQRQEYAEWINRRRSDIQEFYTKATSEMISEFLLTYEVRYIIVGTQEHRFGNPDVLNSYQDHPALQKVFESGENIIFSVNTEAIWTSISS